MVNLDNSVLYAENKLLRLLKFETHQYSWLVKCGAAFMLLQI